MRRERTLARSPLREAVLDIRVLASGDATTTRLREGLELVADDYPVIAELIALSGEVRIEPDATHHTASRSVLGLRGTSADGKQVAQFRLDGFTFNRLAPYTTWDQVFPEAMRLWQVYREAVWPDAVSRVALRYVNDMRFPRPLVLGEVLTVPPAPPPGHNADIDGFLERVTFRQSQSDTFVTITQTLGETSRPDEVSIILDIDAFRNLEPAAAVTAEDIGNILGELRELKNAVFFDSITESAARRFE